ncbi:hypothetical protein BGI40_01570 [Snodgrassella communis]|uniref:hypothetical protein n=1 Tax=Snodgrassella communis TaxID=2946699 RepID=UPI00055BC4E5|nr:hypothetical protein [Snodgrassella communis]PIT10711.1 hypothetical protein BGI29_01730 [Snodgrassella communis]PIT28174.1 hypothetical protein BGI38_05145 [Snodgrassella communis]PIT30386.1 hypothetical protein BGI39_00530 [Snodgrassella communis]PIT37100.1 hypothetical protein BGI40_01570 [Snodgrassella communis]
MDKNTCVACCHWILKEKNHKGEYVTDELIKQGGWGWCRFDERWRYFSYCRECPKGKFEPIEEEQRRQREEWIARKNAERQKHCQELMRAEKLRTRK